MERVFLDVDDTRAAQLAAVEQTLELPEIDAEIGADHPHLVGREVGAGEVHGLAAVVQEQHADRVLGVGEQIGEDVLEAPCSAPRRRRRRLRARCPRRGVDLAGLEGAEEGGHHLGVEAAAGQLGDRLHRELRL